MSPPSPALVGLSEALGLGTDPDAVLIPLRALYAELDREIAERAAGLELPCASGCDACCHESVFLSAPEFLAVAAELLATRTAAERAAIVAEMGALAERWADELELLEILPAGAERDEVAARVKFRCPLLDPTGRCSVYAARELNARTFGQSTDAARGEPYGCELTHARLRVLDAEARPHALYDARDARRRLVATVPATAQVHVYPWWFRHHGNAL